jgi:DNA-binding NarL/FixJ family response regulator
MQHDTLDHQDCPRGPLLSVALVSREGIPPGVYARPVRDPCDICPSDDVVLFYGSGMAHDLRRFSAEMMGALPPAVVLAPRLDWDDVHQALDNGAGSYLLENRYVFLLDEALLCTARGASILDPVIAAEQVRVAGQARARAGARQGTGGWRADHGPLCRLSPQERQIMSLLATGLQVREVSGEMCLTEKTVRNYLSRIYAKLHVRGMPEALLCWLGHLETPEVRPPLTPGSVGPF